MSGRYQSLICVVGFCCLRLFAQQNPPSGESQSPASAPRGPANRHMTLEVTVADRSGQLIPDLQQQDFTLLDNKQPQQIVSFRAVQREVSDPPEVVFVIDEVNAGYQTVAIARKQLQDFLKRDAGKLARPASLVFFSDKGAAIGGVPTSDGNALIAQMNDNEHGLRTSRRSEGAYGALERVQLSLNALGEIAQYESKRPARKLVIWISPGWALLSGPNIRLSPKDEDSIFRSVIGISDELRNSRITLSSVDPLGANSGMMRTFYYKDFLKPVKKPNQVNFGNVSLQVIATQSGGLVLNSSNDIAGEIARCFADASSFYELSFDGPPADGPNDYHALEVKIDKPGLTARTRAGYYAQP